MMRKKIIISFLAVIFAWTAFAPIPFAEAVSPTDSVVAEIKSELATFSQEVSALRARFAVAAEPGSAEALARLDLLRQFQAKMQTLRTKIANLRGSIAQSQMPELARGVSGDEVTKLQEFLGNFPRVYPEKLVTGTFGPLTEKAVKTFQTSVGHAASGVYDIATRDLVNILRNAGVRKKPPKIQEVTPDSGAAGITIALRGTGFTDTGNAIVVRGKTVMRDLLASAGGTRILFTIPENFPCEVDSSKACPIKVVNAHGISNARPFKLEGLAIPGPGTGTEPPPPPSETTPPPPATIPPPSPTPPPPPSGAIPPPPPSGPLITSISPNKGPAGTLVTIKGTGFTNTGNKVNVADTVAASNLKSQDGTSVVFTVPSTPCLIGQACPVSVTNANGTSNSVAYLLTQALKPIKIATPNGGEIFIQTKGNTIRWTGGTDRVDLVLVNDTAVDGQDPTELIVGWIASSTKPDSSITWDAKRVCTREGSVCSDVEPGTYKMLAVSEDELGDVVIWNDFTNALGNVDISDNAFTIRPEATITVFYPNGGEIIGQRSTLLVCWESYNVLSKLVNIILLRNGTRYLTIASNYPQTDATGAWIMGWDVPDDLPTGSDYSILIEDAKVPVINDTSDGTFQVVRSVSSIIVQSPGYYSADQWFVGFKGYISWESAYLSSAKAVDITLYKAGVPYRTLGTKVPQNYYWDPGQSYSSGWFFWDYDIPMDIPDGDDYMIEIADSGNLAVKDFSDQPFSIVHYPDTLTLKSNLANYFTGSGIPNAPVSLWDGVRTVSTKTDINGWFAINVPTSYVMSAGKVTASAEPNCFENQSFSIYKSPYQFYRWSSAPLSSRMSPSYYWDWYGYGPLDKSGVANYSNYYSQRLWPMVENFTLNTDAASKFRLTYRDGITGVSSYSYSGGYNFLNQHTQARMLPEKLDSWLKLTDKEGTISYSPLYTPALGSGCGKTQTLSHFQNNYQWEPYTIPAPSASFTTKVGTSITKNMSASGGTAPYTWSVASGGLAPQLGLQSGGMITGTTTAPGQYEAFLRVQDINKVSGAALFKGTVLRSDGTLPPTIAVTSPQAQSYVSKSWESEISWSSTNVSGTNVRLELWKAGAYLQDIATFTQTSSTGVYSYTWRAPSTAPNGAGYTIKIVDVGNLETFGLSDPFWINDWGSSSLWNWWTDFSTGQYQYSQSISFRFAASMNPEVKSLRLYVKTPTDTSFTLATTLTDFSQCSYSPTSSSVEWGSSVHCDYWGGSPYWYLGSASHPASYYPVGEYQFKVVPVDSAGVEKTPIATLKSVAVEHVSVISPTEIASPIKEQTPTIRWSVPASWSSTIDRYYQMTVYRSNQNYSYNYYCDYWWLTSCNYGGVVAPSDTTGFRKLTGALTADIKYDAKAMMYGYMLDPATGTSIGYIGMSAEPSTFWYSP